MTRIYTRTGDDGTSALIGGRRVSKNSLRLEAYGTVDELNAFLGRAIAEGIADRLQPMLHQIQNTLFDLGAELAMEEIPSPPRICDDFIHEMERWIDELTGELPPLSQFILPGGSLSTATLHIARTVCRRAERRVVSLKESVPVNPAILRYLNRLSDLLFILSRFQNQSEGLEDVPWKG